jgi:hypothetical protein
MATLARQKKKKNYSLNFLKDLVLFYPKNLFKRWISHNIGTVG